VSTDLLQNNDWTNYKAGRFYERGVRAVVLNAGQHEELRMKICGNLIKQGFISTAAKCLQVPIPKNVANKDRLKDLHPPDRHTMGDMREDGLIADIIFDQEKINAIPRLNIGPVYSCLLISYGELTEISKPHDPDGIRPITMCEKIRKLCFIVLVHIHQFECDRNLGF
jgi:hypothetical protein